MAATTAPAWRDWRLNPPTAIPGSSATLSHHKDLGKLPVPLLKQTVEKLYRSASALAKDDAELRQLKQKLDAFAEPGGLGEDLTSLLEERRSQPDCPSWLAEWWDTQGYMAYRDPVVINVSYYYAFSKLPQSPLSSGSVASPYDEKPDPAYVAATLVSSILDFRALLLDGKIEPDVGAGGVKLDMESYKWMFNACRIPAKPYDYAIKLSETDSAGSHFIAIRNNKIYKLPLFDKTGKLFCLNSWQQLFEQIYAGSGSAEPVGLLTGVHRDTWTDAREHLLKSSTKNAEALTAIEAASFVLCLDPAQPKSRVSKDGSKGAHDAVAFSRALLHGDGQSRWFDKPMQWVLFDSGEAGFIGEHSCMDGTPTAKVNDYIGKRLSQGNVTQSGSEATITASELAFEVDQRTKQSIADAKKDYQKAIDDQDMNYLHYPRYGKEGIKAQKCSPDGWVQMTMQLAYALTYPEAPVIATYEAAMTRRYALGRTETVRVCSPASKAFVLAMLPNSKYNDQQKRELFMQALQQHGKDMKDASNAQGCDRHLFGMKMIAAEKMPDEQIQLFQDDLLKRSSSWRLSTSLIYSKYFMGYGWGQVVPDGFGLPYSIHDNHLVFTVTSRKGQKNAEYTANLKKAADMLMDMSEHATQGAEANAKL